MTEALNELIELLDLEAIEVNIFRGKNFDEQRLRVFGGQVAAQSLVAAGRTVESGRVHSLHSYFLRAGDPTAPILYEVDRIRDGRVGNVRGGFGRDDRRSRNDCARGIGNRALNVTRAGDLSDRAGREETRNKRNDDPPGRAPDLIQENIDH